MFGGDNRNYILAIALSLVILVAWQYFYAIPQMEKEKARQELIEQSQAPQTGSGTAPSPGSTAPGADVQVPGTIGTAPSQPGSAAPAETREAALAASPRVPLETPSVRGSINLKGGRIDDVVLKDYRVTVEPTSPNIVLLSPSGSADPYYVELGWVPDGTDISVPGAQTVWSAPDGAKLTPETPVTLTWDNGQGLTFKRTIAVDENYMFTVADAVENAGDASATLYPYGLVSRHGEPSTAGFFILHEGLIGVLGDEGLVEIDYDDLADDGPQTFPVTGGWLGITDKYWAAVLVPDQETPYEGRFISGVANGKPTYQADFLRDAVTIAPGSTAEATSRIFAGAKEVGLIDGYETQYGIKKFELLIDWGWFYFLTKPLFFAIDYFYRLVGNFGVAILIVTVLIKIAFFPLANKSYVSMSRMKLVQPQMMELREKYKDDKLKQQQAMMELYKKEKINPLSGCLPIVLQIPVFFALYKVLFVTIEMRHAPFFGWIQDLSAPDPTTIFNLFGVIPWDPPQFLMLGAWPLIMGITMWIQMRLNPPPPDPTQAMIFNWMPVVFTFMLASFPAGLVIYWSWNNTLSVLQQYTIMRRQGVKPDIFGNMAATFSKKKRQEIAEREAANAKAGQTKNKPAPKVEDDEDKPAPEPARKRKRKSSKPTKPAGSEAGE
ncbi:membrane protein insertase YidC [Microbaculum marinum]|uniref:Membrane protein insertase YidC n=1 Tax=Microbaculum marinum TaxID=1764581 RepID=A0AAW9RS25_9HYPH